MDLKIALFFLLIVAIDGHFVSHSSTDDPTQSATVSQSKSKDGNPARLETPQANASPLSQLMTPHAPSIHDSTTHKVATHTPHTSHENSHAPVTLDPVISPAICQDLRGICISAPGGESAISLAECGYPLESCSAQGGSPHTGHSGTLHSGTTHSGTAHSNANMAKSNLSPVENNRRFVVNLLEAIEDLSGQTKQYCRSYADCILADDLGSSGVEFLSCTNNNACRSLVFSLTHINSPSVDEFDKVLEALQDPNFDSESLLAGSAGFADKDAKVVLDLYNSLFPEPSGALSVTYCVSTTNINSTLAVVGDFVVVTVTASQPVLTPTITCSSGSENIEYDIVSGTDGSSTFVATHGVTGQDFDGHVTCSFTVTTSNGDQAVATQNSFAGCSAAIGTSAPAAIDRTPPTATFCASPPLGGTTVVPGQMFTVTITANEPIRRPTVRCNSRAIYVSGTVPSTTYTAVYIINTATGDGQLTCEVTSIVDTAGNSGIATVFPAQELCFPISKVTSDSATRTPSRSPTRTATPSRSPPPRSPSPVASPSSTRVPIPASTSPAPVVSPTPLATPIAVSFQLLFNFAIGSCRTEGCLDENPGVDNTTIRALVTPERVVPISGTTAAVNCVLAGGAYSPPYCITPVPFSQITDFDLTNFETFVRLPGTGIPPPTFLSPPHIVAANIPPNWLPHEVLAAVIDCKGQIPEQPVRFAYLRSIPGPCFFDTVAQRKVCSNEGISNNNELYVNKNGQVLSQTAIWATSTCPA